MHKVIDFVLQGAGGNLISDGTHSYAWDAENRLISITYAGQAGKATQFVYDGLGRRVWAVNTPVGGATLALTSYVWCGAQPCQARNAASMPTREYYAEGEVLPGATPTMLYYGLDQIGGVRRVFASSGASPAYAYDPYGAPLQSAAPLTDRGYAGMLTEPNSGLGLTLYRAYNPAIGRWLSRDPAGEATDQSLNL